MSGGCYRWVRQEGLGLLDLFLEDTKSGLTSSIPAPPSYSSTSPLSVSPSSLFSPTFPVPIAAPAPPLGPPVPASAPPPLSSPLLFLFLLLFRSPLSLLQVLLLFLLSTSAHCLLKNFSAHQSISHVADKIIWKNKAHEQPWCPWWHCCCWSSCGGSCTQHLLLLKSCIFVQPVSGKNFIFKKCQSEMETHFFRSLIVTG